MEWFGFIKKFATAIGAKPTGKETRGSVGRTAAVLLGLIGEYKAESIEKIQDSVLDELETEVEYGRADVEVRVAEAAEKHAAAEVRRADAALKFAKADAVRVDAETRRMKATSDAVAKLLEAMAKIKRAGGSVAFIESELAALLHSSVTQQGLTKGDEAGYETADGTIVMGSVSGEFESAGIAIKLECSYCGEIVAAAVVAVGQKLSCPKCNSDITPRESLSG